MKEREVGKTEKYKVFKDEIARMKGMKKVIVILLVVGALGSISSGFGKYIAAIRIEMKVEHAQKTALLGTARVLRLVLGCKKKHHKCDCCAGLCETFDNRLLSALTESAGATNSSALSIINNDDDNNNDNNSNNNGVFAGLSKLWRGP